MLQNKVIENIMLLLPLMLFQSHNHNQMSMTSLLRFGICMFATIMAKADRQGDIYMRLAHSFAVCMCIESEYQHTQGTEIFISATR